MSLRRLRKIEEALAPPGPPRLTWVVLDEDRRTVRSLRYEEGRVERPQRMTAADLPKDGSSKVYIGRDPEEMFAESDEDEPARKTPPPPPATGFGGEAATDIDGHQHDRGR